MFDFKALYEAHTVEEAIALRAAHPAAEIIAGGSDQLVRLRNGKLAGCELISIYAVDALRGVEMDFGDNLIIGALTSFSELEENPLIRRYMPVLAQAAGLVGGPQVRNIGTIGGNVANGVTSADTATTLLAWDAEMELRSAEGKRYISMEKWYLSAGKVNIRPDEILTHILIPRGAKGKYAGWYEKYAMRNAMDIAAISCSLNLCLSADKKTVEDVRVAFGVAAPVPVRAYSAEAAGRHAPVSAETAEAMVRAMANDIAPRTSWRAKGEFRAHIAGELLRRCFREAVKQAGGAL